MGFKKITAFMLIGILALSLPSLGGMGINRSIAKTQLINRVEAQAVAMLAYTNAETVDYCSKNKAGFILVDVEGLFVEVDCYVRNRTLSDNPRYAKGYASYTAAGLKWIWEK